MEFKFKTKASLEFELKTKATKRKEKKKPFLIVVFQWIGVTIVTYLLEKLVAWIIELILNGSFYYFCNNRFFCLRRCKL